MSELLQAAKAVIDCWHEQTRGMDIRMRNLRAAVEQVEQGPEPVAWLSIDGYVYHSYTVAKHFHEQEPTPLYRHPPRQPVWLTDDEVKQVIRQTIPDVTVSESVTFRAIARAIKAAVLEKNQ